MNIVNSDSSNQRVCNNFSDTEDDENRVKQRVVSADRVGPTFGVNSPRPRHLL